MITAMRRLNEITTFSGIQVCVQWINEYNCALQLNKAGCGWVLPTSRRMETRIFMQIQLNEQEYVPQSFEPSKHLRTTFINSFGEFSAFIFSVFACPPLHFHLHNSSLLLLRDSSDFFRFGPLSASHAASNISISCSMAWKCEHFDC